MSGWRHVAVADCDNGRVSVFSVEGEFVRHVGVDTLSFPSDIACSAFDELVVADGGNDLVVVFSASGKMLVTMGQDGCSDVAVHGGAIFAQTYHNGRCVAFT
jgi:hypothetical protein